MSPEERARADAINEALSASIQERKKPSPPPRPADNTWEPRGKGPLYYGAIIAFIAVLHVVGVLVYSHWQKKNTEERELARQAEAENRRLKENVAHAEFMRQQAQRDAQRARIQASAPRTTPTATSAPMQIPTGVQYNATPSPASPSQRPVRAVSVRAMPSSAPLVQEPVFTNDEHAAIILRQARNYFNGDYAKNLGVMNTWVETIRTESTVYDSLWNKYVTKGRVTVRYSTRSPGSTYTRTLEFEGDTQVKGGAIQVASSIRSK